MKKMDDAWHDVDIQEFMGANKIASVLFTQHLQNTINSKKMLITYDLDLNGFSEKIKEFDEQIAIVDEKRHELIHKIESLENLQKEVNPHESTDKL